MKIKFLSHSGAAVLCILFFFGSSCSDDEARPLNDKPKNNVEVEYPWAATADSLQEATYTTFLHADGVYRQDNAGNNNFNYWWNAHMLDVLVDGYLRTRADAYKPRMIALLRGIKVANGNKYENVFVDDMEWLGISSLRAYEATNDHEYLAVAKELWAEIKTNWSDVYGGGLTWKSDAPFGKNACSNAPGAILALQLYQIENNPDDLEWAKKIYNWQKETLVDPLSGLVWDNIDRVGGETVINKDWIFTYNQGTYIGAATALHTITGENGYLNDAIKTANSCMTSSKVSSEGVLRDEGQGDGGLFKGILIRYLTNLIQNPELSEGDRKKYVEFLQFNARTLFNRGISRPSMMCSPNWRAMPGSNTDLSTQLSGVMLIEAAAKLKAEEIL